MPHFPTPSRKPSIAFDDILKSSESRLRGKILPSPFDGQISLASIFSTALWKKDFPLESAALFQNGRMGLTFRQLDVMSRRMAKILGAQIQMINRNLNPQIGTFQEAPSNSFGEVVIGILTQGNHLDERLIVYVLAILKLGAGYVHVQKGQLKCEEDWKLFIRRVQPLLIIQMDDVEKYADFDGEPSEQEIGDSSQNKTNFQPPGFVSSTKVISLINTDTGKHKLPLPYLIRKSSSLWKEAIQMFSENDDVVPLKLKIPFGQRTAMVFSYFIPGNGLKWTRIGHRIIHNRIHWEKMEFPVEKDGGGGGERCFMTYPISDPRSLVQLFLPLCIGKSVTLLDPNNFTGPLYQASPSEGDNANNNGFGLLPMDKMLQEISQIGLYRLTISSQYLEELLKFVTKYERHSDLCSVGLFILSGGQQISLELGKLFFQTFPHQQKCILTILYGTSENLWAATWVSYSTLSEVNRRAIDGKLCLGNPLPNMLLSIIDDKNWTECSAGEKGEIYISTHGMGLESINFIQTGDLGRIVKERGIYRVLILDGKTNSRVKVVGKTIDFYDLGVTIEKENFQDLKQCIVFVAPRTRDAQTVVVAYVPKPSGFWPKKKPSVEKLIKKTEPLINSCLEVNSIPYLPNGQVDFRSLRKSYHEYLTECDPTTPWSTLLQSQDNNGNNNIKAVPEKVIERCKILVKSIATSIGKEVSYISKKLNEPFSTLLVGGGGGGVEVKDAEATRIVRTIHAAENQGYILSPEDFINSVSIKQLINRMRDRKKKGLKMRDGDVKANIKCVPLRLEHWNSVISLLKTDFDSKATMFSSGSLERYWKRALDDIMKMGLSLVAFQDKTMVGCALNCVTFPRSEYVPIGMNKIFGLIQTAVDASRAETLTRSDGSFLQSFYIAVNPTLFENESWKIIVIRDLLQQSLEMGQNLKGFGKFGSYLVCTADPLIQEVATCLLNYRPLLELPMNRYKTSNFEKPFWEKDDHEKIGVYFKAIEKKKKASRSTKTA